MWESSGTAAHQNGCCEWMEQEREQNTPLTRPLPDKA